MKNKVLAIVGPTGSGKTMWAKTLAKKFQGKIISVDSRQIYRGLDIGTAKDKTFSQDMIDILNPDQPYSVADYQKAANGLINQYLRAKNLPILVGGTGLYMEAVLYGFILPELKEQSLKVRAALEKMTDAALAQKLQELDPASSKKIDPKNKRRLIRALEVCILSGRPFSLQQKKRKAKFDALILGIETDRETLYSKIDARVEQMIKDGLVEEVRKLIQNYRSDLPAFNTIGYREIIEYLNGKQTLKEAVEKIKTNSHAYVRRQETWWRRDKNVKWVSNLQEAEMLAQKFLQ